MTQAFADATEKEKGDETGMFIIILFACLASFLILVFIHTIYQSFFTEFRFENIINGIDTRWSRVCIQKLLPDRRLGNGLQQAVPESDTMIRMDEGARQEKYIDKTNIVVRMQSEILELQCLGNLQIKQLRIVWTLAAQWISTEENMNAYQKHISEIEHAFSNNIDHAQLEKHIDLSLKLMRLMHTH